MIMNNTTIRILLSVTVFLLLFNCAQNKANQKTETNRQEEWIPTAVVERVDILAKGME